MFLKKLTIKGFKSFEKLAEFEFLPGISAIVGPNGSGKSNVVDALLWVMGEQATSVLRSSDMHDVIFAGSSSKAALGRAEVEIVIDNSDGELPLEYSEVALKRVLFRSGTSEYRLNDQNVRLVDIQDLLSDSNLGKSMHTIVGQGRLDNILNASPENRREYIEEAAGILKFHQRKEKSLRKLEQIQPNLVRLEDLIYELKRQMGPLARQAKIARKAQFIQDEIFDLNARLLADDYFRHQELAERDSKKVQKLSQRLNTLVQDQTKLESEIESVKKELSQTNPQVQKLTAVFHELKAVRERYWGYRNLLIERIRHYENIVRTPVELDEIYQDQVKRVDVNLYLVADSTLAKKLAKAYPDLMVVDTKLSEVVGDLGHILAKQIGIEGTETDWVEFLPRTQKDLEIVERSVEKIEQSIDQAYQEQQATFKLISEQNEQVQKLSQNLQDLEKSIDKTKDELRDSQVSQSALALNWESVREKVRSSGIAESDLTDKYAPQLPFNIFEVKSDQFVERKFDRDWVEKRLESSARDLENLGKVNPWAVEEFTQLEERQKFLDEQLTDLLNTRAVLLELVKELDEKVMVIFKEAFEDTAREFKIVAESLFPGGKAELFLTDPKNLLETGVEMRVTPAGKQIKHLSLLSGGERSLTALTLIIAIFKARPSPFYVLDEVEAALDDENLQRLLTVFEELKQNTQLIVITHQKPTMVISDVLYGISMNQDGVSKVISTEVKKPE